MSGALKVNLTDLDILDTTIPILFGSINSPTIGLGLYLHLSCNILCLQLYMTYDNIFYYRMRINSNSNWNGWNILGK